MKATDVALAYAQEVYAACATVGFEDARAARLKELVEEREAGRASLSDDELVSIAQKTHSAAVEWVTRG